MATETTAALPATEVTTVSSSGMTALSVTDSPRVLMFVHAGWHGTRARRGAPARAWGLKSDRPVGPIQVGR
jgi:hypothetical protein